ncbi:hypothetical protein WA026_023356 [Henosepilachna vigintioctopunctata]
MVERSGATVFIPKIYGPVIPTRYEITVNYMSEIFGYVIDMDMDLTYANMFKHSHRVHIQARYGFSNQWYGAPYSIRFTPNPIFKEQYGKYFTKLRNHRAMVITKYGHEDLIVTPTTISPSCLLLISVNVAKHEVPLNISAILMCNESKQAQDSFRDVATQTFEYGDFNDYASLLQEVTAKIWGFQNPDRKIPLFEKDYKNSLPYVSKEFPEYPMGIICPEEYDAEFPEFIPERYMRKGNRRRSIMEKTIPTPVPSSFVQNNKLKPITGTFQSKDRILLPNFEDAFLNQEIVAPMYDVSIKRKRGRPKREKSFNMVTKSDKVSASFDEGFYSQAASCSEKSAENTQFTGIKQELSDTNFITLNKLFDNTNEQDFSDQIKDINFELELIDQLIKEDSEKNLIKTMKAQI